MSPQWVADAANPHPYPFVVRQERLPPDNRERNGKPKKSKPRPRADRNTRQEEEVRFNTGPRNLRGAPVNRGGRRPFRMLGRYDRGYDDHTGVPDYPPPSFQEAMTTPPLSACSSTTTLVPVSIPAVLIPEDIPEVPEVLVEPSNVETLNESVPSDHGSDSDESLQIIDKSSVVGSDDLPKGVELEQRIRNDWKIRRGLDFPGSSCSDSSQNLGKSMDMDRGRSTLRVPGRLTIDPDASVAEDQSNISPISPTKRRFLSLSPLRTILSPRLTDRPMSAHPSPSSSPYAASSRNVFFRSSMNLATSSMMKLPMSLDKNDNSLSRKLFGKGKEKLDTWEVLDEVNYPDEFEAEGDYPSSLMSAVQSLKLSTVIVGDSPTRSQSYTVGVRPSTRFPNGSQNGTMHEELSSKARQTASLRAGALLDRQIWGSPASVPTSIVSGVAVPQGTYSPPARSISPVLQPRVESSTPAPSILKNTAPPIRPSPLRPTVTTENQASSSTIYQQALDTPLPATPVYRDIATISARSVPDLLNDSISAREDASCLAQINFTEEPMTPNRHHYTGRPLPRPPPSVTRSNIDSTFAPEVVYDADKIESHSSTCPEGLLIDLNDTSRSQERLLIDLDDTSLDGSGASTPLSDGAHLRSQLRLTITPSSSAAELTMEPGSDRPALSDSMIRGRSSPITSDVIQPFEPTELDLLASRVAYGGDDGSDYETLLLVSELIGPASPTHAHRVSSPPATSPQANANISLIGQIEVKCRRKTKDGRVKLKLYLLDVRVNECGICLSQFKDGDKAGLTSVCQHSFHEMCLARWLARNKSCPLCRVPLDVDIR